jgi:hypothetical protein
MRGLKSTYWLFLALIIAVAIPMPVFAQGCAMCYQSAANSGSQLIQALRAGILVLLFPPLFICAGITRMAYRKRNQCGGD